MFAPVCSRCSQSTGRTVHLQRIYWATQRVRYSRTRIDLSQHFFSQTRWNRSFQIVRGFPDSELPHQPYQSVPATQLHDNNTGLALWNVRSLRIANADPEVIQLGLRVRTHYTVAIERLDSWVNTRSTVLVWRS